MTTKPNAEFSTDHPLSAKEDDRLNRSTFAERIASVLLRLPSGASLVVGIHGPWGDGKTTLLNIIRTDLAASSSTVTMDFNPWRFTDESAMLTGFFQALAKAIGATLATKGEEVARLCASWARTASFLDDRIGKAADLAAAKADIGLEELRVRLSEALEQAGKRIVVLVDDIDRLDKHETHTLFRLIKACADFPNLSYVLAFDDVVVAEALGERYGASDTRAGRAFLEKIIQVPLKVPVAAKEDLRALCFEQIDAALSAAGLTLSQDQATEFVASFDRCVSARLTTPRSAKRYANGLMFAAPMLKDESDPVDMLLVEALRAFFPEIYDVVRQNHDCFSGEEEPLASRQDGIPRSKRLLDPIWQTMTREDAAAGQELLTELFPRLRITYRQGNLFMPTRAAAERKVSSPKYCSRYFTYTVARNDVADVEVAAIISAATADGANLLAKLEGHLSSPKVGRLIEKLRVAAAKVDARSAAALAVTLAKLGTKLPQRLALFSFAEPHAQAAMLIAQLLRQISDRSARLTSAKEVAASADPLRFSAECVRWMYTSDDPDKQDKNTLTLAELAEIRTVLATRIKECAAAGTILFGPDIQDGALLLYAWRKAEGTEPVQAYLEGAFERDPLLVEQFLHAHAPMGWADGPAPRRLAELHPAQVKDMQLIIDLNKLAALIRKNYTGNFDTEHLTYDGQASVGQQLVAQFMFIYRRWKADGIWREPDDHT